MLTHACKLFMFHAQALIAEDAAEKEKGQIQKAKAKKAKVKGDHLLFASENLYIFYTACSWPSVCHADSLLFLFICCAVYATLRKCVVHCRHMKMLSATKAACSLPFVPVVHLLLLPHVIEAVSYFPICGLTILSVCRQGQSCVCCCCCNRPVSSS